MTEWALFILQAVLFLLLQLWNAKMHPWSYYVDGVSREVIQDSSVLPIFVVAASWLTPVAEVGQVLENQTNMTLLGLGL